LLKKEERFGGLASRKLLKSIASSIILALSLPANVTAQEPDPYIDPYLKNGYTSVGEAAQACRKHFRRELRLPIVQPPVPFTHHIGRCENPQGRSNDHLSVEYLNEKDAAFHFIIMVYPIEQKWISKDIPRPRDRITTYKLSSGNEAVYGTTPGSHSFNLLVFQTAGWTYILSVDKRIEELITAEHLVQIANSIEEAYR
jgi:hypothetical protein